MLSTGPPSAAVSRAMMIRKIVTNTRPASGPQKIDATIRRGACLPWTCSLRVRVAMARPSPVAAIGPNIAPSFGLAWGIVGFFVAIRPAYRPEDETTDRARKAAEVSVYRVHPHRIGFI